MGFAFKLDLNNENAPFLMDTFILGAGFSYSFNREYFPLTDDLMRRGLAKNYPSEKSYSRIKELLPRLFNSDESINFEKLATYILNYPFHNLHKGIRNTMELYLELIGLVANTLVIPSQCIKDSRNYSILKKWIEKLNYQGDSIITFNYDLIIEVVLEDLNSQEHVWNPLSGYCMDFMIPGSNRLYPFVEPKDNQLKLIKPHGSLNWWMEPDNFYDVSNKEIYFSNKNFTNYPNNPYQGYFLEKFNYYPYIIPPLVGKKYEHSSIKRLWTISKQLLENSKRIFLIGYSLPESDVVTEYMLREANLENKEIFIVRPLGKTENAKDIISRFENIFFTDINKNKLYFINKDAFKFIEEDLMKNEQ